MSVKGYINPQWKGTTLCADWRCPKCGEYVHTDSEFIFHWTIQCDSCGQWFALSHRIDIVAVDSENGNEGVPAYEVSESVWPEPA